MSFLSGIVKSVPRLFGGDGDNGGYGARQESDEQRKAAARAAINRLFGIEAPGVGGPDVVGPTQADSNRRGLDALYQSIRDKTFAAGTRALDEQYGDQSRSLRFELAARGLSGGSTDVFQNSRLSRALAEGRARVSANADDAANQLRTSDEQARIGLLQGIDSGMDQGSALSSALSQMRNNSDRALAAANGQLFGDLLGTGGGIYADSQRRKGQQRAQQWWASQMPPRQGTGSVGPVVTRD